MLIFRSNVLFLCLLGGLPAGQPDLATDSPVVVTGAIFLHSSTVPTGPGVLFVQKLTASPTELPDLLQRYRSGAQQAPLTLRGFSTFGEF